MHILRHSKKYTSQTSRKTALNTAYRIFQYRILQEVLFLLFYVCRYFIT